ncbi:MAG: acyltransferase family protein [Anaerolineales bacterium]
MPLHFAWVDLIRVVAVFQVVLIHLSYPIFFKGDMPPSAVTAANFYDSLSRMGVPLFFMVSGALLLGKREPTGAFLWRRFVKVGIPALFWSVAYLLWSVEAYRNGSMSALHIVLSMLKVIYLGDVEIHLWFLYVLGGIYLVTPLLRLLVSAASRRDLAYFLLLWLIGTSLTALAKRLSGLPTAFEIPVATGYVGYFIMGYWLVEVHLSSRGRLVTVLGMTCAVLGIFWGTLLLSARAGRMDDFLYSYFSLPTILASVCAFLLLKDLGQRLEGGILPPLRALSAASFGVYLVHILVIDLLRTGALGFRLYSWMGVPWLFIPLTALAVFLLSFLFVSLLRVIPFIRMIVP